MTRRLIGLALAGVAFASPALAQDHAFVLTGAGRYAVLADMASIRRDGDTTRMRAFQAVDPAFTAGGESYWGGWSWWAFDCADLTADRLDFASVREGGREGPATPDTSPAYPASPGGDAAELLDVACSPPDRVDATTLAEAVRLGRAALAELACAPFPWRGKGRGWGGDSAFEMTLQHPVLGTG